MSERIKDRHLLGAGAAACAVCCAPPLLALVGLAGAGLVATVATLALAGLAFGAVVLAASVVAVWVRRRATARVGAPGGLVHGPVDVVIGARPDDVPAERGVGG